MNVGNIMTSALLSIPPEATLREAAQRMSERNAGAALLFDVSTGTSPGIITERDMLDSMAAGQDPDNRRVADNATSDVVIISPEASVEQAAQEMLRGDFRHLLVVHEGDTVGVVSMRDLVRALTSR